MSAVISSGLFALHLAPHRSNVTGVEYLAAMRCKLSSKMLRSIRREIEWIEANAFDLLRDDAASGQEVRHHRSRPARRGVALPEANLPSLLDGNA